MTTDNGGDKVGMKDIEGYLDNLATAATNKKSVPEQLVELVAIVKTFQRK